MTNRDIKKARDLVTRMLNIYQNGIVEGGESETRLVLGIADLIAKEREQDIAMCKLMKGTTPYNVGVALEYAAGK